MGRRNRSRRASSGQNHISGAEPLTSTGILPETFHLLAVALIAVLCWTCYFNSLHVPFVFDDAPNIVQNGGIHWTHLSWSGVCDAVVESRAYRRPVANLSFAVNYLFGQDNVRGYHIVNVTVHLLSGLLVYLLALATLRLAPPRSDENPPPGKSYWIALTAAVIFVCHPIQTQAVTYIVQRMTSMCTMFYLAALLGYIYGRTAKSPRDRWMYWGGGAVCWLLALGSKEIAVMLPVTIILYEWYFFQDLNARWGKRLLKVGLCGAGFLGLIALIVWVSAGSEPFQWLSQRLIGGYAHRDFSLGERLLTQPRVVMLYMSLLVLPLPSRLNLAHDITISQSLFDPLTTLLSIAVIVALLGSAIYLTRRQRLVSFCLLWFFFHLAIESTFIPLELVFEHRLYLPMFGFSLLAAWAIYRLLGSRSNWSIALAALLCLFLVVGTYQRNRVWQDPLTLWSDAVAKSPGDARAHLNLGNAWEDLNRAEEAETEFREALGLDPKYPQAHYNLGNVLHTQQRYEEAIEHYRQAVRYKPEHVKALNNWGVALRQLKQPQQEMARYAEALKIRPDFIDARMNYAEALHGAGRLEEAATHLRTLLTLEPRHAMAYNEWGRILIAQRRVREAVAMFERATALDPSFRQNLEMARSTVPQQGASSTP